jgi:hypothetical protein
LGAVACLDEAVAGNDVTPPSTLVSLMSSDNVHVLSALAANPATPPAVLESLTLAHPSSLRPRLTLYGELMRLSNPSTPPDLLATLAKACLPVSPSAWHCALAQNPSTPLNTLVWYALHGGFDTSIGCNPMAPFVLDALGDRASDVQRRCWSHRPEDLAALVLDGSPTMVKSRDLRIAASCAATPTELLDLLVGGDPDVLESLASNPVCPSSVLARIVNSSAGERARILALSQPLGVHRAWWWAPLGVFIARPTSRGLPWLSPAAVEVVFGLASGWEGKLAELVDLAREVDGHVV